MVVTVAEGLNKPYMDLQGRVWVKSGSDKRHVTAREELQRLFQRAGLVYADVVPVAGTSAADIDEKVFHAYFNRRYGHDRSFAGLSLARLLQNLGLGDGRELTLAKHAAQILPYRGLGSGIPRALKEWPRIDLLDDVAGNQFSAVVWRSEAEWGSVTPEVTPEVARLLEAVRGEMPRNEIQAVLVLKDEKHFRYAYLKPALEAGVIEMTIPDKPRSRLQKYRLTAKGRRLQEALRKKD